MDYKINEVFLSIQGEGPSVGSLAVFVRFSGCNMFCKFCDTEHKEHIDLTSGAVVSVIEGVLANAGFPLKVPRSLNMKCVFTGGEPLLQLDREIVRKVRKIGLVPCVETNGLKTFRDETRIESALMECDEVVVSPKSMDYDITTMKCATALKVLTPLESVGLQEESIREMVEVVGANRLEKADLILQPITPAGGVNTREFSCSSFEAIDTAIAWGKKFGESWKVIPQTHKIMRAR